MSANPLLPFIERYGIHTKGDGPVLFAREVLGMDLDPWQERMLRAFGEGERGISIAACHGPGKTAGAAVAVVYSILFRFPLKAVATAPSRGQLEGALMKEVGKWVSKLPAPLQALLEVKSMSVVLKQAPALSSFEARTARPENPEALQGIHEDEARALAEKLANGPTLALRTMKQNIATALDGAIQQVFVAEAEGQRMAGASADAMEGGMAFLQKRKAAFKGQ